MRKKNRPITMKRPPCLPIIYPILTKKQKSGMVNFYPVTKKSMRKSQAYLTSSKTLSDIRAGSNQAMINLPLVSQSREKTL